jgi:hypothetical protein
MQGDVWLLFFSDLKFLNFGVATVFFVCGLVMGVGVGIGIGVLGLGFWVRELRSH